MENVAYLVLPAHIRKLIDRELNTIPAIHGKVRIQFEMNCGNQRTLGSLKILKTTEEEVRPC